MASWKLLVIRPRIVLVAVFNLSNCYLGINFGAIGFLNVDGAENDSNITAICSGISEFANLLCSVNEYIVLNGNVCSQFAKWSEIGGT